MQRNQINDDSVDDEIAQLFRMGSEHYKEGRLRQAQDICQRILQKQHHPSAVFILGMIAHQQRKFEVAVERYHEFLNVKPNHAQAHYQLGLALNKLGRTELAIEHYEKSIAIAANNAAAHSHLADAYTKLQRWEEAIKAYQQVLALQAEDVDTTIKLGDVFVAARLWTQSIPVYEQALVLQPNNALVHKKLGDSAHKLGQRQKALKCFEQALKLRPDFIEARLELALVLRELGRTEEAQVQLEQVIDLKPDEVNAHISLALTLRDLGQAELAIEKLEQFLRVRPTCGSLYYNISMIKPKQELIPVVEKLINLPNLTKDNVIYCHFSLGNLFKDSNSFDQAFGHYLKGNELHREGISYDAKKNTSDTDRLIKVYSKRFFQGKRKYGSASLLPVFILGMPRSGTTLVEQILSSHPLVHGAGELEAIPAVHVSLALQLKYANPPPECMSLIDRKIVEEYSARYLQELMPYCPTAARITDKLPGNFSGIGLIKTLFPNARIIHCQRDPLDNCISLFFHYFLGLNCTFELTELGQYYLDYQRLMSHWQNVFPGEILNVQYEELVMNQERISKQLIDYIDLEWDEKCIDFHSNERTVMTPSNIQVRKPMYKTSINRWKPYEKHLQPLIEVLQQAHVPE